ncbi:MAG TPA: serine hydrolase domain-containing protein [Gemmatimonadaceae bacterium]
MRTVFLSVLALLLAAVRPALADSTPKIDRNELSAFVDSFMTGAIARPNDPPGVSFVFVQDGRIVLMRGYGLADIARNRKVDPETTVWRIGSISKTFTATAVMQLVDRGEVDLDAPVDRYIHRVSIPKTFPEPITPRHLLTHTAGLDEIRPGTQAPTREEVLPLARFLETKLVRIRPPGRTIAYSTYGITLAGEMVEEVSQTDIETYFRTNIWDPLGMKHASINVPKDQQDNVAIGYEFEDNKRVPQAWEWYHTTPASAINATTADMARYLMMHLEGGVLDGKRVLSRRAIDEMDKQQITMDPSIPGYALGFNEDFVGDLRVLEHGGNMAGFSALMVMIPSRRAGFFVVNQMEGSALRDNLKWGLLQRFFPEARKRHPVPKALPAAETVRADRFAGEYVSLVSCFTCQATRPAYTLKITANDDGTLGFAGGRWIQVDQLRFVKDSGSGYIVFRADDAGVVREIFAGAYFGWQKVQ